MIKNKSCIGNRNCSESRSKSSYSTNNINCNRKYRAEKCCVDKTCQFGQFTLGYLYYLLNNGINENFPAIASENTDGSANIIISPTDLISCQTYYILSTEPEQNWIQISFPFVYTEVLSTQVYGYFSVDMMGDYFKLVAYMIDRINNLCLPCCVKQKITDNIVAYVDNQINPNYSDSDNNNDVISLPQIISMISESVDIVQQTDSLCDNDNSLANCGSIYVANYVVPAGITLSQSLSYVLNLFNFVMNLLTITQYYLRTFFPVRCCCTESHNASCDCNLNYRDACQFVFGKICVIDTNIEMLYNNNLINVMNKNSNLIQIAANIKANKLASAPVTVTAPVTN